MKRLPWISLALVAALPLVACKESPSGSGIPVDAAGHLDLGSTPVLAVAPPLGNYSSNLKELQWVRATIISRYLLWDNAVVEALLKSAVSVIELPAKTTVSGKMEVNLRWDYVNFTPAAPFKKDVDYAMWIKQIGPIVATEYTVFRLGPLPRVQQILYIASKVDASVLESMVIQLSEAVTTATAYSATVVQDAASKSAYTTSHASPEKVNRAVTFKLPAGVKKTDKLRITMGTEVGAPTGVKLDGLYTGKAGSGPLTVECVPALLPYGHWKPVAKL